MGETKCAFLDSNVIMSCSVDLEVCNCIQKKVLNGVFEDNKNPMGVYSLNKNRIKIPREIFPVGETKYAVLDSNVIISCSVVQEVSIYI